MLNYGLYKIIEIGVPSTTTFINIYNVLMLFEQFYRKEVPTAQLPWASDINVQHGRSMNKL